MKNINKEIEIVKELPSVKIGLDDFYGKQTVLKAINEALNLNLVSSSLNAKIKLDIEESQREHFNLANNVKLMNESTKLWNEELIRLEGKIQGLRLALNYC